MPRQVRPRPGGSSAGSAVAWNSHLHASAQWSVTHSPCRVAAVRLHTVGAGDIDVYSVYGFDGRVNTTYSMISRLIELSGSLAIRSYDFSGFRPIFGQTWPQNHSRTTGLVLQCRLQQKSGGHGGPLRAPEGPRRGPPVFRHVEVGFRRRWSWHLWVL